jgi:hypothetical protein
MFEKVSVIEVGCVPSVAFDHIGRGFFENHGVWDPDVVGMEKTSSGPVQQGTLGIERRRAGPAKIVSEIRITQFQPDRLFAFRTVKGPIIEDVDWTIEPSGSGSSVKTHLRLIPNGRPMRILAPAMRPIFARNAARNSERFRAALEALAVDAR